MHAGFCLCTPYLPGPRSTYDVAAPIAAGRKTVYRGVRGDYVVAVRRVGNSHRLCRRMGQRGRAMQNGSNDDVLLAGTGVVGQQLDVNGRMSLPVVCLLNPSTREG